MKTPHSIWLYYPQEKKLRDIGKESYETIIINALGTMETGPAIGRQ
jgi:hypothetical protein